MSDEEPKDGRPCPHCGAGTQEERLDRQQAAQTLLFVIARIVLWLGLDS